MEDPEVSSALGAEVNAMSVFNEWVSASTQRPERYARAHDAVHRVTEAHRRVLSAHESWHAGKRGPEEKSELLAACDAFMRLVKELLDDAAAHGDLDPAPRT